jgi:hypothetical protein
MTLRLFLPALLVVAFFLAVLGQEAHATSLSHTFGKSGIDSAFSVCSTADNGMALLVQQVGAGAGGNDFMLVKTNSVGVPLWT